MANTSPGTKTVNNKWQKNLLPFMTRAIILMAVFFFLASLLQLIYLNAIIAKVPQFNTTEALSYLKPDSATNYEQRIAATRLKSLILLENAAMAEQYHQANILVMAKLWTTYIGFVTGMILAITGAAFILGKLIEPVSELESSYAGNKLSFKSASPGLSLCVLGTILMLTTLIVKHEINTLHNSIYISDKKNNDYGEFNNLPPLPPTFKTDTAAANRKKSPLPKKQPQTGIKEHGLKSLPPLPKLTGRDTTGRKTNN